MAPRARQSDPELPSIEEVLHDPAASSWLRNALNSALVRDPVDAANNAELLARILDARCQELLRMAPDN
jgi:hypothetical protein